MSAVRLDAQAQWADTLIGPSTVNYPPPEGRKPDAVHTLQTNKESALLYR